MIDVGVRQDHGIDFGGVEGEFFVALESFFATALVQATVEQDLFAVVMDHVHRTGNGLGGAPKLNFHVLSICKVNWFLSA